MGFHTYDIERADAMDDPYRFRYCSIEELLALCDGRGTIADLGSGTGFFTQFLAPHAARCYAIDVQSAMHERFRASERAPTVELVTAEIGELPLADDSLDGAFSTFTFHEFNSEAAIAELARTMRPGGTIAVVDWSADGPGDDGPPTDHRYSLETAVESFRTHQFAVDVATERYETFALSVRRTA